MKSGRIVVLTALFLVLAGVDRAAGEEEKVSGQWSGFTLEQIVDHLGLKGGNITFEFDEPVYLNIKVVEKKKGEPERVHQDDWTAKASTHYDWFTKVEHMRGETDPKVFQRRVSVFYTQHERTPIDGPAIKGHINYDVGRGFGMNWLLRAESEAYQSTWAWHGGRMDIRFDEAVTVYEIADRKSPEEAYYRLTILFTPNRPLTDDE